MDTQQVPLRVTIPRTERLLDPDKESGELEQVAELCRSLNFMSSDDENKTGGMDLIKSDATALTKWVTGLLGAGGVGLTLLASVAGWFKDPGQEGMKIALVAAMAVVLTTVVAVIGWVTVTDVNARATVQQERYHVRRDTVGEYFRLVRAADFPGRTDALDVHVESGPPG